MRSQKALPLALVIMWGAASGNAAPRPDDPFDLVLTWRAVQQLSTLTAAERTRIEEMFDKHRDAIRRAPTDAAQRSAAGALLADVDQILTVQQRTDVVQAVQSARLAPAPPRSRQSAKKP